MNIDPLIFVRFSIRNQRWKAKNVRYDLDTAPGALIRQITLITSPQGHYHTKSPQQKNHICFENTPRRSPAIHIWAALREKVPNVLTCCMFVRSAVRVVTHTHTDRHTHRRCQNYYTRR